jgi:hypothetical protein
LTILVAILGLILLIVIHELGHMLVAKAMGVHVPSSVSASAPPSSRRSWARPSTLYA